MLPKALIAEKSIDDIIAHWSEDLEIAGRKTYGGEREVSPPRG
ncbi:hypothetical protein [Alicyclobacillus mengziensis]|nr:hypothetical protein [Alicyclobacillus mengziensis]